MLFSSSGNPSGKYVSTVCKAIACIALHLSSRVKAARSCEFLRSSRSTEQAFIAHRETYPAAFSHCYDAKLCPKDRVPVSPAAPSAQSTHSSTHAPPASEVDRASIANAGASQEIALLHHSTPTQDSCRTAGRSFVQVNTAGIYGEPVYYVHPLHSLLCVI